MRRRLILLVAMLTVTRAAGGAELVLRDRATPRSAVVRLGDVAEIAAADAGAAERLAATPLTPAPTQAATRYLRAAELRDLLASRGVDVRDFHFTGAAVVAIGPMTAAPLASGEVAGTDEDAAIAATAELLTGAIVEHLRRQTGHDLWKVEVDADDDVLSAYRQTGAVVGGGAAPWSGRQRFTVTNAAVGGRALAYARVERLELAAVSTRSIERGEIVRRSDIELRPHAGALPKQAIVSLDSIVGKEALQGIRTDSLLQANQFRAPLVVRRGERVMVRARTGGVSVRTYAVAQQDGGMGDLVTVQSLEGKQTYAARVSGLRELEIFVAGADAREMAALADGETR